MTTRANATTAFSQSGNRAEHSLLASIVSFPFYALAAPARGLATAV
jgi:hypothetical protein